MTQQQKDSLHIKKQNRRLRKLIFLILLPVLFFQLLCTPLYVYMIMLRTAEPSEPVEIRFEEAEYTLRRIIIEAKDGRRFLAQKYVGGPFWEDVKAGRVSPGDTLIITSYTWPIYDRIATLRTEDRVYADAADFEKSRAGNTRLRLAICGIAIGLGALGSTISFLLHRRELAEACRLRRKYKDRLQSDNRETSK